jgi:hypothetical protein
MASIGELEGSQIDRANASGKTPVVFVHGLWLLPQQLGPVGRGVRDVRVRGSHARVAR